MAPDDKPLTDEELAELEKKIDDNEAKAEKALEGDPKEEHFIDDGTEGKEFDDPDFIVS